MTLPDRAPLRVRAWPLALALRSLGLGLAWWVLAEGRADSWTVGVPSVALAVAASLRLSPPGAGRISVTGVIGFAGFFLLQSARSGVQVAGMALRVPLDLAPAVLDLSTRLPPGPLRVLLAYTLALLPGTMSVRLEGDRLRVHVLDARLPVEAEVRAAQARIARLLRDAR